VQTWLQQQFGATPGDSPFSLLQPGP
jgi:hypothetical protein